MMVIKWAMRHGALTADHFGTIEDAVHDAEYAAEYGEEACIGFEADGRWIDFRSEEYNALAEPMRAKSEATFREQLQQPLWVVQIQALTIDDKPPMNGSRWANIWSTSKEDAAREFADTLKNEVDERRIHVKRVR